SVDREDVLVAWLRHFDRHLVAIGNDAGRIRLLEDVRAASSTIGRDVRVESTNESFDGQAVGIADDGRLLVDRDGTIVSVTVGDIVHARLLS
ncbi:MAG: biotin--[acetyl-CoA-carboxylase] ligase, partial [Actinobacteria bacterium]|nr:biotin--[acetyl-CoA-carboxylase] ligase [Actinomycetota bacterium]